ncbi:MAG: helix-turn-helix transcriptional regulator [Bacteroidota bacterium]
MNLSDIVLIVAASHSFLLALLIFQKHRALYANRFLAALLLCFTLISVHLLIQDAGVYQSVPAAFLIVGIPLTASPLQYLYTKYLLRREIRFASKDWLHFSSFIIFESGLIITFMFGLIDFSSAAAASPSTAPLFLRLFNMLLIIQGIAYVVVGLRKILRYDKQLKNVLSSIEQVQLSWLRNTTLAMLSAWILFLVEDTLMTYGINLSNFVIVSVVFAVYVYAMGVFGLMKSEIFASPDVEKAMHAVSELAEEEAPSSSKYERSGLSPEMAQQYVQQLIPLMEEKKLFTDASLSLSQLAELLTISAHNLSEVINSQLGKNFYDFVNGYRLEEVKKGLADPAKQHLKILSIAFDAGFNSKATFNTLFKQQTGKTPSEYRNSVLQ